MAIETYLRTAFTTSNGAVDAEALQAEIQADAGIVPECLGVTKKTTDVDIEFDAALSGAEQTVLDGLVAAHTATALPEPTEVVQLEQRQADGTPIFVQGARLGKEVIYATHNFTDPSTWYSESARVTDETLSTSDDLVFDSANTDWIDMTHGKVFDEDALAADQQEANPGDPHGFEVIVKSDGVVMTQREPFAASGGDYTVNCATGQVTFAVAQTGKTVTASYSHKGTSGWILEPIDGKVLTIEKSEVQFSDNIEFAGTLKMETFGLADFFAPHLLTTATPPGPLPPGTKIPIETTYYKTMFQLIDEAIGSFPPIPAFPSSSPERAPQQALQIFQFHYGAAKLLFSSLGMHTRISIVGDTAFVGERATATFYLTSHADPGAAGALQELLG